MTIATQNPVGVWRVRTFERDGERAIATQLYWAIGGRFGVSTAFDNAHDCFHAVREELQRNETDPRVVVLEWGTVGSMRTVSAYPNDAC